MEKEIKCVPLQGETRFLKNGIELTIYSGGTHKDYDLPKGVRFVSETDFKYADENNTQIGCKIIGKTCNIPGMMRAYNEDQDCNYVKKVKIQLKNGQEIIGMLSEKAIEELENTKILPIIVGESKEGGEYYLYSLVNLENNLTYDIPAYWMSVPFKDKFSEGYFASRDFYLNLNTMKPLKDNNKKVINGVRCFNFHNGVCVVVCDNSLKVYNTKGDMVDEAVCEYTRDKEYIVNVVMDMYDENEQIIYENGEFYQVNKKGKKSKLDYIPEQEINPM